MPRAARQKALDDARLTVDDYFRMIDSGEIDADARVELWEGRIVDKMSKSPPHQAALTKLMRLLFQLVPAGWFPTQESPVSIDDDKVPEPDSMIVRGDVGDYTRRPPAGKDVALVIEVSVSSLKRDLGPKKTAYAAQNIPFYWVVNLAARRVEVYSRPNSRGKASKYESLELFDADDRIPIVLDDVEVGTIAVSEILP